MVNEDDSQWSMRIVNEDDLYIVLLQVLEVFQL